MISSVVWNLGGSLPETSVELLTNALYAAERGTNVYSGRPTKWSGAVGLMYPSDYGYATSGGSITDRNTCLLTNLNTWGSVDDCKNNDWLRIWAWTLTPNSSVSYRNFVVWGGGSVSASTGSYNSNPIYPVVYLNTNVMYQSGSGTSGDPIIIQP